MINQLKTLPARLRGSLVAMLVVAGSLVCPNATAQGAVGVGDLDAPLEEVVFSETDTIRGLVGQFLRDPDLWPAVLRLNGIASVADLVPGTTLKMPVQQVAAADAALADSLTAIQSANAEGAQIFAPNEIGSALDNRNAALSQRIEGDWRQVVSLSNLAVTFAEEALQISIRQRDRAAEAVVSDVQGDVEGRAPAEPKWSNRVRQDVLVEFERVRTLSDSTTQITFRDLSRLRLNANSNATIQRMRSDPLTGGEVTKVSLANGDFYALLNQLSDKSTFEIDVPGIETTTNSADFWIKNDPTGARFVNFDEADLSIRRGEEEITVGANEGIVISGNRTSRAEVLTAPLPQAPDVGEVIYTPATTLRWDAFDGAEAYWVEVALDPGFNQMKVSEWGVRATELARDLPPSRYHWRVAALDQLGLPGQWSSQRDFIVRQDATPPFLTLLSPASGSIFTTPSIEILGATEPDAMLTLNGVPLVTGGDGSFLAAVDLMAGENTLTIQATDPAGNVSERVQTVVYRPTADIQITLADDIPRVGDALASRLAELSVIAQTNADEGALVRVRGAGGEVVVQLLAAADGSISFTVPVVEEPQTYSIEVLSPSGTIEGQKDFTALRDQVAPQVTLDVPPPRATGEGFVDLAGIADDAVSLELNGTRMPVAEGRFSLTLNLEPGLNIFELRATDAVGNVSVTRLQTLLDVEPPEILSVDVRREGGANGPILIEAQASDASGLVQAAPFLLDVGGVEIEGFLRCDSATGLCRGTVPPTPGRPDLIELIIEDYAGNAAFY
ncbi:MAG: FecR domain-containing protein [Paracoccaceae bacterium]